MFKKYLNWKWISDNITMLLLIPTIIGGFWQIIELMLIGTAYIRFFSISQVVPDGLVILLLGTFVVSAYLIFTYDSRTSEKEEKDEGGYSPSKKRTALGEYSNLAVIVVLTVASIWWWFKPILFDQSLRYNFPLGYLFVVLMTILFILRMLLSIARVVVRVHKIKLDVDRILDNELVKFILIALTLTTLLSSVFVLGWFHQSFFLSGDMKNQTKLMTVVQTENPGMKMYNLRYFNDKYVFVELVPVKGEPKILVMEFSAFFADVERN